MLSQHLNCCHGSFESVFFYKNRNERRSGEPGMGIAENILLRDTSTKNSSIEAPLVHWMHNGATKANERCDRGRRGGTSRNRKSLALVETEQKKQHSGQKKNKKKTKKNKQTKKTPPCGSHRRVQRRAALVDCATIT